MKKIIIIMLIVLMNSGVAFAYVTNSPLDYGVNPKNLGGGLLNVRSYYKNKRQPKPNKFLTKDVSDLQNQIIEIDKKDYQLELRIQMLERRNVLKNPVSVSKTDIIQNNKIGKIEKRVDILETVINNLKGAINKTLNLLQKVINLLTK